MSSHFTADLTTAPRLDPAAQDQRWLSQKDVTPQSNVIGFAGDSITAGSGAATQTNAFIQVVPLILGTQRADQIYRAFATGGYTSGQIAMVHIPNAVKSDAGIIHFAGGTNDCDTGLSVAGYAAIVTGIYDKIRAAGKLMSISHIPPRPSAATAQWRKDRAAYNDWISRWAPRMGVPIADTSVISDPTTGYMKATYNADATHPNDLGHAKLAEAVATAIGQILPVQARRQVVSPDVNLLTNGIMGTSPAAGLPTNWSEIAGGTGDVPTYSTVADTTGTLQEGLWLQMAWAPTTAGGTRTVKCGGLTLNTNFVVGDQLEVSMAFQIVDVSGFQTAIEASTATITAVQLSTGNGLQTTLTRPIKSTKLGRMAFRFNAPNTSFPSIGVQVTIPNNVSVQVRWGEVLVRNLTTLGLAGQYPSS